MNQKTKINGYDLSRTWFNFCFDNPDIIKPHHSAIYFFAVNQCNRFGWKEKFGFPTTLAMEAVGIRSYRTYINALNDIVEWGFFKMIEKSKNQYTANIIALVFEAKAHDKALDKATQTHMTKQGQSTGESKAMVVKPLNHETIKPLNKSKAPTKKLDAPSQNESLEVYKEPTVDKRQNLKEKNVPSKKTSSQSKVYFENSLYYAEEEFREKLIEAVELGVDIEHYHMAMDNWSISSNKKRTSRGWIATAQTWMRRDKEKNKLRMLKTEEQKMKMDADMLAYLKIGTQNDPTSMFYDKDKDEFNNS